MQEDTGMFQKLRVGDRIITPIDWEMNPSLSFGTFESWGGRERVRNNNECVYYFFIDNWGDEPKLCLMERAVKHAKILAEIKAPQDMIRRCVEAQGKSAIFEKSYAIDKTIREWLIENVLTKDDSSLVVPIVSEKSVEDMGQPLPSVDSVVLEGPPVQLPSGEAIINDDQIAPLLRKWNFFDRELNPDGDFANCFAATEQREVIVDLRTQLMWQTGGIDIGSIRHVQREIETINRNGLAGFHDWRMPSMEEAMSIMSPVRNNKQIYLEPCFSKEQAFIFVNAQRKPGGYWFVDYKQGRAFWSSGTIPGGFGRLVRTCSPKAGLKEL
ncbi:MAG: hypothetical protein CSA20_01100 [Deltaproteobacteria bacterium]|nr:MAG: hypothetical protein CSA20_01100 [Deltaproteobacteria bacterium]